MLKLLGVATILSASILCAEEPEELNISEITFNICTQDMGAEWQKFVDTSKQRFKSWSIEYDNSSMKQFLDDRLIALAPKVISGKGVDLKEFCKFLALYHVFCEQVPSYIRRINAEDRKWIQQELVDFNWDSCAKKIAEKAK